MKQDKELYIYKLPSMLMYTYIMASLIRHDYLILDYLFYIK